MQAARAPLSRQRARVHRRGPRPARAAREPDPDLPKPRPPPPAIASVRAARAAGLAGSAGFMTLGAAFALTSGLLTLPPWVGPAAGGAAVAAAALLGAATAAGRVHLDFDAEGLHAALIPPYDTAAHGSARPDGRPAIVVRPTPDGRGNGAFVRGGEAVPAGAWLGAYEGELLDEPAFWARYGPSGGTADYCMRIDRDWTVDGVGRAGDVSLFSPCHINHARGGRANVARVTRRAERKVDLYAARDLFPGEELLLDYGRLYWLGREAEEVV